MQLGGTTKYEVPAATEISCWSLSRFGQTEEERWGKEFWGLWGGLWGTFGGDFTFVC